MFGNISLSHGKDDEEADERFARLLQYVVDCAKSLVKGSGVLGSGMLRTIGSERGVQCELIRYVPSDGLAVAAIATAAHIVVALVESGVEPRWRQRYVQLRTRRLTDARLGSGYPRIPGTRNLPTILGIPPETPKTISTAKIQHFTKGTTRLRRRQRLGGCSSPHPPPEIRPRIWGAVWVSPHPPHKHPEQLFRVGGGGTQNPTMMTDVAKLGRLLQVEYAAAEALRNATLAVTVRSKLDTLHELPGVSEALAHQPPPGLATRPAAPTGPRAPGPCAGIQYTHTLPATMLYSAAAAPDAAADGGGGFVAGVGGVDAACYPPAIPTCPDRMGPFAAPPHRSSRPPTAAAAVRPGRCVGGSGGMCIFYFDYWGGSQNQKMIFDPGAKIKISQNGKSVAGCGAEHNIQPSTSNFSSIPNQNGVRTESKHHPEQSGGRVKMSNI